MTALKLDAYREYFKIRIKYASPHWISATVLYEEIKKQGYEGKISLLRHYLKCIRPAIDRVKRFIRYVRHNFYQPLLAELKQFDCTMNKETANEKVLRWLDDIANQRIHATTLRIPFELLAEEI